MGSDRLCQERSQLPAATTTETDQDSKSGDDRRLDRTDEKVQAVPHGDTAAPNPEEKPFQIDKPFQERSHRQAMTVAPSGPNADASCLLVGSGHAEGRDLCRKSSPRPGVVRIEAGASTCVPDGRYGCRVAITIPSPDCTAVTLAP